MLVNRFTSWDYGVFGAMLSVSAAIGLYFGCTGSKQATTSEFLMADRKMGAIPVALSLLASFMSAITLLGTPAEIYNFGTVYIWIALGYCITIPVAAHVYMPIFCRLNITSSYEYLERRFNKAIRRCGSLVFILQMTMYMSIVLYAPALALSQVTGLHTWGSVVAIGVVCTFYTTVGGMKAVMWTDAFQMIVMFGAMLTVVIKGCLDAGGLEVVWEKNVQGNRIQFWEFNPDPRVRHSFWSLTIGGFFTWIAIYGVNQAQVQRYLTTPTMATAQKALWWNLPGLIFLMSTCAFGGLVIYAQYWKCDPQMAKKIATPDQLLPLFVMDTLGELPGFPGLFVAGIFSGALSTISSGMNSLAAVTLEDFVKSCCFPNMSEKTATMTSKLLAMFYGALCIGLVAAAEKLGGVLQAALSIFGIVGGPLLGVFTLGMFFPMANSVGAGVGVVVAFSLTLWIGIGAQLLCPLEKLPMSIEECSITNDTSNLTIINTTVINATDICVNESIFTDLYSISYLWYSAIACSTVVTVGLIISYLTGKQDPSELNPDVISPLVKKLTCCFQQKELKIAHLQDGNHTEINGIETISKEEKIGLDNTGYSKNDFDSVNGPVLQSNGEYTTNL